MARVDVIILNYNGEYFLRPCLTALKAQTYQDFEIILVDNASTDGSLYLLKTEFPEVRVLALPENLGFCAGNNRGIQATSGEYVALLNNDTEVTPGWLEALVNALDRNPEVGFCASLMIRISDRKTIDSAGIIFFTHGVGAKRGSGESAGNYIRQERVFGACAGAAIYRRNMLQEIGFFDESFFAFDEDIDLSFRAQLRGYKCQYVPEAVVFHHVGGSFNRFFKNNIKCIRRNMLETLLKNMPFSLLFKYSPQILLYYVAGDIAHALRGHASLIMRARWDNFRRLLMTLAKRYQIQQRRSTSVSDIDQCLTYGGWSLLRTTILRWWLHAS